MKFIQSFLLLFILAGNLAAQTDTTVIYYNRYGKEVNRDAAITSSLRVKENDRYKEITRDIKSGWVKAIEYFSDPAYTKHEGSFKSFFKNGKPLLSGEYYEDKKTGLWKTWTDKGVLIDSAVYKDGFIYGLNLSWDTDGKIIDSSFFSEGGNGATHTYWSDGTPRKRGSWVAGKRDGLWVYYYENGVKCQEVNFIADSAASYTCYDKLGKLQTADCVYEKEAVYPGGEGAWTRYLVNKISRMKLPDDYYKGKIFGQVWVQFIVETDGSLSGIEVTDSVDPRLDAVAVNVIKSSPRWEHAVQNNRPVKAYRLQPFTFPKAE